MQHFICNCDIASDHHPSYQTKPHFAFLSNAASKTLLEPN
jgi:hypothetical protein